MFMNLTLSTFSDIPLNIDGNPSDSISWIQNIHPQQLLHVQTGILYFALLQFHIQEKLMCFIIIIKYIYTAHFCTMPQMWIWAIPLFCISPRGWTQTREMCCITPNRPSHCT